MKQLLHGKTESNKPHTHVTNTTQSLFPGQSASLDSQQIKPTQAPFPVIHYIVQFHPNLEQLPKNGLKNWDSIVNVYMYVLPILIQTSMYTTTCKMH